jgi:type IV secretory pathway VirB10-like protein
MNEPVEIKGTKPPGLLPKHVQSWLLIGVALVMVLIMWLTGGKKPLTPVKSATTSFLPQPPAEVSETKIAELQNRIQELQRQQLVAQSALAEQNRVLGRVPADSEPPPAGNTGAHVEDSIQTEKKKRDYLSLFASNVALSFRKNLPAADAAVQAEPSASGANNESAALTQLLKEMRPPAGPQIMAPAPASNSVSVPAKAFAEASPEKKEERKSAAASVLAPNAAAGKHYVVFEGTVLEAVLINRLEGQFSGPIECLLSTDVFSHDRQHVLVPAGTKLLGEIRTVENFGQTRLAVAFHRLVMPDGYSVSLDQFKGLDQIGDTGLRDQVNNHYLRLFGASLAVGALGAVAEAGTGSALTASGGDQLRQGFSQSMAQSTAQILDRFLNVLPTVTIREGHRVKVYLSGDLALPDYTSHTMPSDL